MLILLQALAKDLMEALVTVDDVAVLLEADPTDLTSGKKLFDCSVTYFGMEGFRTATIGSLSSSLSSSLELSIIMAENTAPPLVLFFFAEPAPQAFFFDLTPSPPGKIHFVLPLIVALPPEDRLTPLLPPFLAALAEIIFSKRSRLD